MHVDRDRDREEIEVEIEIEIEIGTDMEIQGDFQTQEPAERINR